MRLLIVGTALLAGAPPALPAVAETVPLQRDLAWSWEPWVLLSLATASAFYAAGILRMQERRILDRVIGRNGVAAFACGVSVLFLALASPLDALSDQLFSAHMVQHLLLLLAAPPLVVAGRPAVAFIWAFGPKMRKRVGRLWRVTGIGTAIRSVMHPVIVWLLFSGAFVFWHAPGPYQWALRSESIHTLEHLSFVVTALMFWTIVIEPSGRRRIPYGATLVFVATTAIVSGLPGALIFLAPTPLYPVHAAGAAAWGLTLVQDQEAAGVIMWIPAGLVHLGTVLWVFLQWLRSDAPTFSPATVRSLPVRTASIAAMVACMGGLVANTARASSADPGGNARRGASLIETIGCGACHSIPGIDGADGLVGPPLMMMGRRSYLAGLLPNTPDNMIIWLRHPQQIVPGNAMPEMGISAQDARDIAAYLDSLR